MLNIQSIVTSSFKRAQYVLASLMIVCLPLTASLNGAVSAVTSCTPSSVDAGVHVPVGSDADAFTCESGIWQSSHYTFDPITGEYTPRDITVYTCDPATKLYSYVTWLYNAPTADYIAISQTTAQPPVGAAINACPLPPSTANATAAVGGTGPNSSNTANNTLNNSLNANNTTNATINNNVLSRANSGNATVLGNTGGGDADSGHATVIANELNFLQSSGNFGLEGKPIYFVANIDGDVNGDFLLDPATLGVVQPTGPGSSNSLNNKVTNTTRIDNTVTADMVNNIDLVAQTGDATVSGNTEAGDAKTGNAKAVANIINVVNSAINAGHSFIGVVNINGNLNGDILLPADFVDQLLAANVPTVTITGPNSTNTANSSTTNNTTVNNTNNLGITNNVNSSAGSGSADVTDNTAGGSAKTGSATTSVTAFNLTGARVNGKNNILVFVNNQGTWIGLIVNAPNGATAASLGGGISQTGPNSSNSTNNDVTNDTTINNTNNNRITNNVRVGAKTGNASVNRNTKGGNAASGDAETAVNLLNVEDSTFSLSGWFGVLFINVFGTWNGSFGINTAAGNAIAKAATASGAAGNPVISFVPHDPNTAGATNGSAGVGTTPVVFGTSTIQVPNNLLPAVLAAQNDAKVNKKALAPALSTAAHTNWALIIISTTLFVGYVVGDRLYDLRRR